MPSEQPDFFQAKFGFQKPDFSKSSNLIIARTEDNDKFDDDGQNLLAEISALAVNGEKAIAQRIITPKIARSLLNTQIHNRRLHQATVDKYAAIIKRGEWNSSTEIRFDYNKRLLDGQHRLAGVEKSGTSTEMTIVIGYRPSDQAVFDQGRSRTFGDAAIILGDNCSDKQFAIARALLNSNQLVAGFPPKSKFVYGNLVDLIKKYRMGIDFCLLPINTATQKDIQSVVILSAVARAYYSENQERLRDFLYVLRSGSTERKAEAIKFPDAALKLREIILSQRSAANLTSRVMSKRYHRLTLNAIRHFCAYRNIKRLVEPVEDLYLLSEIDVKL